MVPYTDPERAKERYRRWYQQMKEDPVKFKRYRQKCNEAVKRYYRSHKDECYRRARLWWQRRKALWRTEILDILGTRCTKCGYDADIRALVIDHVDGGGKNERKKYKDRYYQVVLKSIKGGNHKYQVLCANCNLIKSFEEKENMQNVRWVEA